MHIDKDRNYINSNRQDAEDNYCRSDISFVGGWSNKTSTGVSAHQSPGLTVNSNMINSKFALIRIFPKLFARLPSFDF